MNLYIFGFQRLYYKVLVCLLVSWFSEVFSFPGTGSRRCPAREADSYGKVNHHTTAVEKHRMGRTVCGSCSNSAGIRGWVVGEVLPSTLFGQEDWSPPSSLGTPSSVPVSERLLKKWKASYHSCFCYCIFCSQPFCFLS